MQKREKVRLTGKALKQLNEDIYNRDHRHCIICETWIDEGVKFHHEPQGSNKQDRVEGGVMLCSSCHHERHFGKYTQEYKERCEEYLEGLYGGTNSIGDIRS